ncbi:hypothetical protein D3C71_358360 [compost metagenome]
MALAHFRRFCLEEGLRVHGRVIALLQLREQVRVAAHEARFEQARLHGDVGLRFDQAFIDRADAVADFQAQVPQQLHQFLELFLRGGVRRLLQQDQQVDVGIRKQFAPAIAAHAHQGRAGRQTRFLPGTRQHAIDAVAQAAQQFFRLAVGLEGRNDALAVGFQLLFQLFPNLLFHLGPGVAVRGMEDQALFRIKAGGGGMPGETVSTS